VPYVAVFPPRLVRISRELDTIPPRPFLLATFGLSSLNLLVQLCNALGWPHAPGPALFVLGLVIWLIIASLFFALLVLSRPAS